MRLKHLPSFFAAAIVLFSWRDVLYRSIAAPETVIVQIRGFASAPTGGRSSGAVRSIRAP